MGTTRVQITEGKQLTPPRTAVLHGWVSADVKTYFEREANRRRMHPDALAAWILTRAASRDFLSKFEPDQAGILPKYQP